MAPPQIQLEWELEDFLRAFWIHKWLILCVATLFGGYTAFHMQRQLDIYQATAQILIETDRPRPVDFRETVAPGDSYDVKFYKTEYKIITSPAVLQRVISKLNLADLPPFSGSENPADVLEQVISIKPIENTKLVNISATGTDPGRTTRIANSVADAYIEVNLERRQEMNMGGERWLQEEVTKLEEKLRVARLAFQTFQERHGNITLGQEQKGAVHERLQQLNDALTKLRKERIEKESKYRRKHPVIRELLTQELQLHLELIRHEEWIREKEHLAIQYDSAQREVKANEDIYNTLLARLKELSIQGGLQTNNVQVVKYARVPKSPVGPNRKRHVLSAIVLGILLGGVFSVSLWQLSKPINSRQRLEQVLEAPFLGEIPFIRSTSLFPRRRTPFLFSGVDANAEESIRAIRATLEFILPQEEPIALMIACSLPSEGKSLICTNLALAFQEVGKKVVVVDADMRRPTLHGFFPHVWEKSLSRYLQGQVELDQLVQTVQVGTPPRTVGFIPAGPGGSSSSELLASSRMQDLVTALKKQYRYCLFDTPPVVIAADTTALAKWMDGFIYVVFGGRTPQDIVASGKQRLMDVGAKPIGGILNGVRRFPFGGARYYYYAYRGYQERDKRTLPVPKNPEAPDAAVKPTTIG